MCHCLTSPSSCQQGKKNVWGTKNRKPLGYSCKHSITGRPEEVQAWCADLVRIRNEIVAASEEGAALSRRLGQADKHVWQELSNHCDDIGGIPAL